MQSKSSEKIIARTVRIPTAVLLKARARAKKEFSNLNAYIVRAIIAANNNGERQ